MQFASPTRNNNVGDCQKTSSYKVKSHFALYSPSLITCNLNFLKINLKFKRPLLHRETVRKKIQRHQTTRYYKDARRPGCPRMSTNREDRLLVRQSLQNRRETVPHLRIGWIQNGAQASNSTVRRRLKEAGLVAHVALKKPLLTAVHRRKRLQFAMAHADWTWVD